MMRAGSDKNIELKLTRHPFRRSTYAADVLEAIGDSGFPHFTSRTIHCPQSLG